MAAIWCKEGTREAADALFKDAATPEDKEVFLFSNDETIDADTVNADLTEIVTNGGEKQTLTKATWDAATDADPVVSRYNGATGVVFTITGALTVYGWAVRGVTSTKIYCAENTGVKTFANGDTYTLQPFDMKLDIV
jgi:hypothetical protein